MTQDIYSKKQNGKQIRYAGLLIRFAACVIDILLITNVAFTTAVIFAFLEFVHDITLPYTAIGYLFFMFIFIAPVIFESSVYQGTPGKQLLELKVIDKDGKRISFESAVARNIGKLMTVILAPLLFPLSILSIILTKDKKALPDFSCNTFVVYDY